MKTQDLITEVCKKHSLSLDKLAKMLGYNRITLWRYATGRIEPRLVVIGSLEDLLKRAALSPPK